MEKGSQLSSEKANGVPRRTVMAWLTGLINAGVGAAIIGPVAGFLTAPVFARRKASGWIPVMKAGDLAEGQTVPVTYSIGIEDGYMKSQRSYSVYVARRGGEVVAFDPTCPHLGCHVEYREARRRFICPCHGGSFDADGKRVAGPPPRDLDRIAARVEHGRIWLKRA